WGGFGVGHGVVYDESDEIALPEQSAAWKMRVASTEVGMFGAAMAPLGDHFYLVRRGCWAYFCSLAPAAKTPSGTCRRSPDRRRSPRSRARPGPPDAPAPNSRRRPSAAGRCRYRSRA